MRRRTLDEVARSLDRSPGRRLRRAGAALSGRIVGSGRLRLPGRVDRLLRRIEKARPFTHVHGGADGGDGKRALLVTNDLSASGAPRLVYEIALLLLAAGHQVTVLSPKDGPFRQRLFEAGATVILDSDVEKASSRLLAAAAPLIDFALCNTIVTEAAVARLAPRVPLIWFIHEISLLSAMLDRDPKLKALLARPTMVWAGSELPAAILRPLRPDVEVMPYGLDPIGMGGTPGVPADRPVRIGIFGSYEPRKGQDLAAEALALLPAGSRARVRLVMHGRILFEDFHDALVRRAATMPEIALGPALDAGPVREAMLACDAVLMPSRDDTLPMVTVDALGCGRVLLCTRTTGTAAYLRHGADGFIAEEPTAASIAQALEEALARRGDWPSIGEAGRALFERTFSKAAFADRIERATATLLGITTR